jgi:hypothetical protein
MKISPELSALFGTSDISSGSMELQQGKKNKQVRYITLMRGINVSSYSTFGGLQSCDRKFAIKKMEMAKWAENPIVTPEQNVDFAFGKAIETGVHCVFLGKSPQDTFMEMFTAWDIPLHTEHPKGYAKTFVDATIAIDKLRYIVGVGHLFAGWEVAYFNDKPAIELAMVIDLENGYYYCGHADLILYNPIERRYRVLEIKTTARKQLDEAMYKNSDQATGYSIMLDSIAKDADETATFEIFYLVFSTSADAWTLFEFLKTRSQRAGWINTILLDFQRIELSRKVNFWPKRGTACMDFFRRCEYYTCCDLNLENFNESGEFAVISPEELDKHEFDFRFKLSEIIKAQEELI